MVSQGRVPVLFCIYRDEFFDILAKKDIGCHIGTRYFGMVAYADDNVLLCPSVTSLKIILDLCHDFAIRNNIKLSSTKSNCIWFSRNKQIHQLYLTECNYLVMSNMSPWAHYHLYLQKL